MEDGFWLFIILQFVAMGPFANVFRLTKFRKITHRHGYRGGRGRG